MEIFIFIIPIVICGILLIWFRKRTSWWEYLLILGPTVLLYFISRAIIININETDTEYYGAYVTELTYYEPWDEMVTVTKTRTVKDADGNETEETYTEDERRYHPAEYTYIDNCSSSEHSISEETYNIISKKLGTKKVFKDLYRDYYWEDGDAYIQNYDETINHCYTLTTSHMYKNKVKASKYSIFKYADMSKEDIKKNKLFDYPDIYEEDQCPILGKRVSKGAVDSIKYINGYYGKSYQFRLYILIFDTNNAEVAEMQKAYWEGGNKNELVVCLGCSGDSVLWCRPFSWCDNPILEVKTRDYFMTKGYLDISGYAEYLTDDLIYKWKRKEFKDFNYLNTQVSPNQKWIIFIIILLYNIGISIWIVTNMFDND